MIHVATDREIARFAPPFGTGGLLLGPDAPVAPPFTPASLPGLTLWLLASVGVTSVAGHMTAWADQSGLHNDCVRVDAQGPTTGVTDSNGNTALYLDPANQNLNRMHFGIGVTFATFLSATQWTVWWVAEIVAANHSQVNYPGTFNSPSLLADGNSPSAIGFCAGEDSANAANQMPLVYDKNNVGAWIDAYPPSFLKGSVHAYIAQLSSGQLGISVDGGAFTNFALATQHALAGDNSPYLFGSSTTNNQGYEGYVAEMGAMSQALTGPQFTSLVHYMRITYGTP